MDPQLPLFASPGAGSSDEPLFDGWLRLRQTQSRPLRSSSIAVYRDMWTTICRALGTRHVTALRLGEGDLAAALQSIGGSARYRKRLL